MVLSDHMIMQNAHDDGHRRHEDADERWYNGLKTGTESCCMKTGMESMMMQSDGTMTQSNSTVTDQSDASEPGSECGPSDHQPLELSVEWKLSEEHMQEGESDLSDGQLLEPLEQPEQLEQCKQAIAHKVPRMESSQLSEIVGSLSDRGHEELHNTKEDTSTPETGRTGFSVAASLSETSSSPKSVSPGAKAALRSLTEYSACASKTKTWQRLQPGNPKLSPKLNFRLGEKVLPQICNPRVVNVKVGPVLTGRMDNLCDQLSLIGSLSSTSDGKSDTLDDAVRKCEPTLPALDCESDTHRGTAEELQEVETMCPAAEVHATEAEIRLKQLREGLQVLKAELQEFQVRSEHFERELAR